MLFCDFCNLSFDFPPSNFSSSVGEFQALYVPGALAVSGKKCTEIHKKICKNEQKNVQNLRQSVKNHENAEITPTKLRRIIRNCEKNVNSKKKLEFLF